MYTREEGKSNGQKKENESPCTTLASLVVVR